jgi:hypothetical protein
MVFSLSKFFHFTSQRKAGIRFIVNQDTVLNIIPVDYVKKWCNTLKDDEQQYCQ